MLTLVLILICNGCFCSSTYYNKTLDVQEPPIVAADVSSSYRADYAYNQNNVYKYYPQKQTTTMWYNQFPGHDYPRDAICSFIDDNKALMRRMYGTMPPVKVFNNGMYSGRAGRETRQATPEGINFCSSTKEIITPYWASNSSGYRLALVNFPPFQQAVHVETCRENRACGTQSNNCFCAQDYTWHRLLAYDAAESCRGIFMEWFRFPSCCICKCVN